MKTRLVFVVVVLALLLSACFAPEASPDSATATIEPGTPLTAERTLSKYYDALVEGQYVDAANLISDLSLRWVGATRDEEVLRFERLEFARDWKLAEYRIVEIDETPELGIAVARAWARETWVEDGQQREDTFENLIVLGRSKTGSWLINYGQFIDIFDCNVRAQDHEGFSVKPTHVVRFLDRTQVVLDADNSSDQGVSWGWVSDELATLAADDGRVYSYEGASSKLQADRSYGDVYFEFDQLVNGTPLTLTLKGWTWLNEHELPTGGDRWSYEFDLEDKCTRRWSD